MFYCAAVQVPQSASHAKGQWTTFFIGLNRCYTCSIVHWGTSCGEIRSSRLFRFTACTTITANKQTSLTWKPMPHSLLWYFLMGVCMFARTTGKDALAVKVTFNGFPRFLPALHERTWNPSPGTTMVIDSFFSSGWLSARFTRDTGVVPVQWIIDPVPGGGDVEVTAANDKKDTLEPGPAKFVVNGT